MSLHKLFSGEGGSLQADIVLPVLDSTPTVGYGIETRDSLDRFDFIVVSFIFEMICYDCLDFYILFLDAVW